MTDFDSLLAAVRADPDNDTLRLAYADALEENAVTVECGCDDGSQDTGGVTPWGEPVSDRCSICHGIGRISDGRAELAEFIRVQVGIGSSYCAMCKGDGRYYEDGGPYESRWVKCRCELSKLRARQRELWPAVRGAFKSQDWVASIFDTPSIHDLNMPTSRVQPLVIVSRGLPAVVRCTLAEWMGGECQNCGGFGEFRRRYDNGDGPEGPCPDCGGKWNSGPFDDRDDYWDPGTGRTPGIGPRLVQTWPIERVKVTDKRPLEISRLVWRWGKRVSFTNGSYGLDDPIYSMVRGDYDSESAARAALSDALIAWARKHD